VPLSRHSLEFLAQYARDLPSLQAATADAERLIESILKDSGCEVHVVTSRTKSLDSIRGKLRKKSYPDPNREITDCIGIRIITYYAGTVDVVVRILRGEFEVDEGRSVDKASTLRRGEFGYKSVHLIARLTTARARMPENSSLRGKWMEIQVRSILQHAWAEIEHEVVYKAGVEYPDEVLRQFASLAGALEILDREFTELRKKKNQLIDEYRDAYRKSLDEHKPLDSARLLGFLEASRPDGLSWRQAEINEIPFLPKVETSCVEALRTVRLGTAKTLRSLMNSQRFRSQVNSFASANGIEPSKVSHLALVVIAIGLKNLSILKRQFPDIIRDPSLQSIIDERERRRAEARRRAARAR
jgi:putative GTP pyrophosphokinase